MPFFSIIIAVFNRAELIGATLDSVLKQTSADSELIVVDDGSTDGTAAVLSAYEARFPGRLRLIHQLNAGPAAARNRGLREARGRYVCFLDSDDLWLPWTLDTYREALLKYGEPTMLLAQSVDFINADELKTLKPQPIEADLFADFLAASDVTLWHGCSAVVMRTDAIKQAGGFLERNINAEDTDLWMKAGAAGSFVRLRSPVTVGYRRHISSAVSDPRKTVAGMFHLIASERAGQYPGGAARRGQRIQMITRHVRPASFEALRHGLFADAWGLYRAAFMWNIRLARWKYLFGFPIKAVISRCTPR